MRRNKNCLFEDFDSSPNIARYLAFKAATFKPRNSSIARTTAGSMNAVLSRCEPQLHGRSVGPGKQVGMWALGGNTSSTNGPFVRSRHKRGERLIGMGRCPNLPPRF